MVEEHIYKLRKILEELEKVRGRHTELVSVYIPAGHNLQEIVNMLRQESTLTENVKNKTVRNNVLAAIDKILQELRFYNKTPVNGLALFAGNVSEAEGQIDIKVWNIEPPEPLRIKKYWCDQKFEIEPLQDMVAERELYGLIVLDNREATIGLLKGKKIEVLRQIDSIVPSKQKHGGQCLPFGTLIPLSNGNIAKIENVKSSLILKSADFNTFSISDSPVLDVYRTKKSEVYKIITKYPRIEIETSKDHFFFVWENNDIIEKPAEDLEIGDILLMPEKLKIEGNVQHLETNFNKYRSKKILLPEFLDEDIALIVGYFLGDGNYDSNRLEFSEQNKELAIFYKNKIEKTFSVNVGLRYRFNKNYYELRACSKTLVEFFKNQLVKKKDSLTTLIPEKILISKDSIILSFLRGFFDAEGYVTNCHLGLGIFNKLLAQQIQLLLLRFSILSSFLEYDSRKNPYSKNHRFTIQITEKKSLEIFERLIGFSLKIKSKKLSKLISTTSNKSLVRRILINGKTIRKLIESYGFKKQDFYQISDFLLGKKNISKGIFEKSFLNKVSDENLYLELKQALDCPILPVIIKEIEKYEKITPMIDLAVKHESFIANGILVHNSAQRFERVREGLVNDWYKIIAENVRNYLSKFILKGIILGGPGPAKNDFYDGKYLLTSIQNQILGTKNIGYTDEQGLEELVERSQDILAEAAIAKEKALLQKFFEELGKDSGIVTYGKKNVEKALEMGAVEIILINEGVEEKEITDKAEKYNTTIEIISKDTREGEQLYQLGGIAAILRWKL
jgi:peptide subunit release factor 1 (eRF1)/intein/homing endonuclease